MVSCVCYIKLFFGLDRYFLVYAKYIYKISIFKFHVVYKYISYTHLTCCFTVLISVFLCFCFGILECEVGLRYKIICSMQKQATFVYFPFIYMGFLSYSRVMYPACL